MAVRILRVRQECTQEEVALAIGLDRSYLGGIERGERNVTYSVLLELARAFGIEASELVRAAERERSVYGPGGSA